MPPASLSLASRPADERFCLITQLSGMLRRESQDYMEEETLLQSLSYFADGLEHSLNAVQPAASQTDFNLIRPTAEAASASFPAFSTACQSLLKKRTLAMNTKQSLGLLAPEEERLEHLLSAQVTTFLQNLRLNTAASPLAGFRSMLRTRQNDLEAGRQPLLIRFHAVLDFLLREFSAQPGNRVSSPPSF